MSASEKAVAAVMETLGCAYDETAAGLFCVTHHCYADQRDSDLDECDFAGRVADLAVDADRPSIQAQALREAREAAREAWRTTLTEGRDEHTVRHWSATAGWLLTRAEAVEAGNEPDWPDAARIEAQP